MNQRVEQMEQNTSSLMKGQQQLVERMIEVFDKLATLSANRDEADGSHTASGKRPMGRDYQEGNHFGGSHHSYAPHLVKLDFPKLNGTEDPTSWICRTEQFFRFHDTPIENQVALASFHLEEEAQLWYQLLQQDIEIITWATLRRDSWLAMDQPNFMTILGNSLSYSN